MRASNSVNGTPSFWARRLPRVVLPFPLMPAMTIRRATGLEPSPVETFYGVFTSGGEDGADPSSKAATTIQRGLSNETQIAHLPNRGRGRTRLRLGRVGIEVHRRELLHPRRNGGVAVQLCLHRSRRLRSGVALPVQPDRRIAATGIGSYIEWPGERHSDPGGRLVVLGQPERPESTFRRLVPSLDGTARVHDHDQRRRRRQPPSGPESSSDSRSESRAEPRA